ncbi:MAG TPA: hypothetical protein VGR62_25700 [Candidatus Binatia bacterium]|nr:hypothetical protein [Candidatus Binatia bacterium]
MEPLALAREPFASNDRNLDNRCDLFDGRYVRGAVIGRDAAGACAATVDAWRATRSTEAALPRGVVVRAPGARFDRVALTDDAFVARDSRTGLGMAWKNNGQPAPYGDVESLLSRIHDDPRAPCTPRPRRDITPWTLEKLFGERRPVAFEALSSDDVLACAPQIYDVYLSARDGGLHRVRSGFAGKPYDDDGQFRQRVASALGDRRVVDIAAVPGSPFVYVVTGDEFVYRFAPDGVPEERYVE